MLIQYTSKFKKQYKKLPKNVRDQFDTRLKLFVIDSTNKMLRVHPLLGKYAGYWSMNVNGDVRALYRKDGENVIIFALIGSHSTLYK